MAPPANPYAKSPPIQPQNDDNMGPQSQRRLTLTERTNQLKSSSKKRKGGQLTLTGEAAFEPIKDCAICKARHIGHAEPHRGHHPLCWNNKRGAKVSEATMASNRETKRLKESFAKEVQQHETFSTRNNSVEACQRFFKPISNVKSTTTPMTKKATSAMDMEVPTAEHFCGYVMKKVQEESFCIEHQNKEAPLAFIALAGYVVETILRNKNPTAYNQYFHNGAFTVPASNNMYDNPQYHSIVGQKLLLIDWC